MASTSLNITQGSGNRRTWTYSAWIKKASTGVMNTMLSVRTNNFIMRFRDDGEDLQLYEGAGTSFQLRTNRKFRDPSAWYHIVLAVDTTQGTSSDRIKLYVNGVQETSFQTSNYPSQNYDTSFNNSNILDIGVLSSGSYWNGSMAHIHFTDGYAYDADTFGETDATTGIWKPKTAPSVTYGTNGFFLKFENSGAFGTDSSGNGNNFTVNGTMTQTIDTPSNVFCTNNPLDKSASPAVLTFSNGNTTASVDDSTPSNGTGIKSGLAFNKGKYYCECKINAVGGSIRLGIMDIAQLTYPTNNNPYSFTESYHYGSNGNKENDSNQTSYGATYTTGDIIGIAMDADNGSITFYKNGTTQGVAFSSLDTSITWCFYTYIYNLASVSFNFGNGYFGTTAVSSAQNPDDGIGIFEYSPPTGYKALCTKSINSQEYD